MLVPYFWWVVWDEVDWTFWGYGCGVLGRMKKY